MGLFLDLLGIASSDSQAVELALRQYVNEHGGRLVLENTAGGDLDTIAIADSPQHNVSLVHSGSYTNWDAVAAYLSLRLAVSAFYFHIHDGDLWMYTFYVNGVLKDQFNPIPDYWDDSITDEERQQHAGSATTLCAYWPDVQPTALQNYLTTWDVDGEDELFAYPDDQYPYGDAWQVLDVMAKLGLQYPFGDDGERVAGHIFRIIIPQEV
jgi:hypothetical protein